MSARLDLLQPELLPFARELVRAAGAAGLQPRVTSTVRTRAEQERLYRRFLAGQQPYPVARPGTSAHEWGWAFDMVVSPMAYLPDVGAYWEQLGGVWGGRPTRAGSAYDPVHFEYPGWRAYVDLSAPPPGQPAGVGGVPEIIQVVGDVAPQFAAEEGSSTDVGQRIVEGLERLFSF